MKVPLRTIVALLVLKTCITSSEVIANNAGSPTLDPAGEELNSFVADVWSEGLDIARLLWKDCSRKLLGKNVTSFKQEHLPLLMKCAKKKTLRALDRTLDSEVISLGSGIKLVKYEKVDKDGKVTKPLEDKQRNETTRSAVEDLYENGDWRYLVAQRLAQVFNTHVLKFELQDGDAGIVESRHRKRHHMMQMMMFGIVSMGMILVPMGFQFLAVLGGKALLLAKMALILAAIQGLKKIATSPINYGLYHSYPQFDGHVEKRGYHEWSKPTAQMKTEELLASFEEIGRSNDQDKIKYKYDSESKLWKPESPKSIKRSYFNFAKGPTVYPVYPVSSHDLNYNGVHPGFLFPSTGPADVFGRDTLPTEIHAEYTIDMPVNKVQFHSTGPLI